MTLRSRFFRFLAFYFLVFRFWPSDAFNIDVSNPVILHPPRSSIRLDSLSTYFGYSLSFSRFDYPSAKSIWLLAGSPRASSTTDAISNAGGALHWCNIVNGSRVDDVCKPLNVTTPDQFVEGLDVGSASIIKHNDSWLGVSVDARQTTNILQIVTCSNRFMVRYPQPDYKGQPVPPLEGVTGVCLNVTVNGMVGGTAGGGGIGGNPIVSSQPLMPIVNQAQQLLVFASQAGTSVHFTQGGNILMGAPGYRTHLENTLYAVGAMLVNGPNCMFVPNHTTLITDNYAGYAVTSLTTVRSGDDDGVIYVTGAPRHSWTGVVFLFNVTHLGSVGNCGEKVKQHLKGPQFGSYFGASLCSVDVNHDGFDDLIVGAPFYNQSNGDEGAAFVYLTDPNTRLLLEDNRTKLTGSGKQKARFGTAIASLGDINLDDYNDTIVGAPYEDEGRGAAYVYLGSETGLVNHFVQRLTPSTHGSGSTLDFFGFAFATLMDVDGNAYPDLAVSAFASDRVMLLRTRPAHTVTAGIEFSSPTVEWHVSGSCQRLLQQSTDASPSLCQLDDFRSPNDDDPFCLLLTVVFNYSMPNGDPAQSGSPSSSASVSHLKGLMYELEIDSRRGRTSPASGSDSVSRGLLIERHPQQPQRQSESCQLNSTVTSQIHFDSSIFRESAKVEWIAVFPSVPKDIQTPLAFWVNFSALDPDDKLPDGLDRIQFNTLTAVLNIQAPTTAEAQISFFKECGSDDACQPELSLLFSTSDHLVIGRVGGVLQSKVVIEVGVQNDGETAYSVWVDVMLPQQLHYASSSAAVESSTGGRRRPAVSCSLHQQQSLEDGKNQGVSTTDSTVADPSAMRVMCRVNKPIGNATRTRFALHLDAGDVTALHNATEVIRLEARVGTFGATGMSNDTRGPFGFDVPVAYDSRLVTYGSKDDEIRYTLTADKSSTTLLSVDAIKYIVHKFHVDNVGPGLVPRVYLSIRLPFPYDSRGLVDDVSINVTHKDRRDRLLYVYNASRAQPDGDVTSDADNRGQVNDSRSPEVGEARTKRVMHLTCDATVMSSRCVTYPFFSEMMNVGDSLDVTINVTIRFNVLKTMPELYKWQYTSEMIVWPSRLLLELPTNSSSLEFHSRQNQTVVRTSTVLKRTELVISPPLWIIAVSIVGGMLALTIIVVLLKTCGFFERKQRQLVKDLQRQSMLGQEAGGEKQQQEEDAVEDGAAKPTCVNDDTAVPTNDDHQSEYDNDDLARLNDAAVYLESIGTADVDEC